MIDKDTDADNWQEIWKISFILIVFFMIFSWYWLVCSFPFRSLSTFLCSYETYWTKLIIKEADCEYELYLSYVISNETPSSWIEGITSTSPIMLAWSSRDLNVSVLKLESKQLYANFQGVQIISGTCVLVFLLLDFLSIIRFEYSFKRNSKSQIACLAQSSNP